VGYVELRCRYCGAPLDVTPDSVVVVCRYCGQPNFLDGSAGKALAVPTLSASEVIRRAVERTKRDFNLGRRMRDINFAAPTLLYLPFYLVDVAMSAVYKARVVVTYTKTVYVGGRPQTRVVTRTVDVEGAVRLSDVVAVLARRSARGLSVDKLVDHFFKTAPEPKPLPEVAKEAASAFLAGEFTEEQAKAKAVRALVPKLLAAVDSDASERARARLGVIAAATSVVDKAVDYTVEKLAVSPLTYLPMWIVPYFYKGSHYSYYSAGWDGAVVVAEEPSFVENKAISAVGAAAAAGLLGGLGAAVAVAADPLFGAAALAGGAAAAYLAAGGLLKSRRVET